MGRIIRVLIGFAAACLAAAYTKMFFAVTPAEIMDLPSDVAIDRLLDTVRSGPAPAGIVHLVGAGPGDADLLTLKAHRLLQHADVIVYDACVSNEVLAMARRDAERLYVGHKRDAEVDERLVALAREGRSVVRLFSGESVGTEALQAAGISVELVPGVMVDRRPADLVQGG